MRRSPEEVIQRVARLCGSAPPSDLVKPTRRPSEARQVALYGLRWWAGEGLSAIARRMGVSDSAVSRRGTVLAQRLREDAQFRSRVERVTNVTLKTCPLIVTSCFQHITALLIDAHHS